MTNQQIWQKIMNYEDFDRVPVLHWDMWPETRTRWLSEGLPDDIDIHDFLNTTPYFTNVSGINASLYPKFEKEIINEYKDGDREYQIFKDHDGVIRKIIKDHSSIPHHVDHTFKTAKDWPEYKKRLKPNDERINITDDWSIEYKKYKSPVRLLLGSMVGWLRNWMGVENMTYLIYDDLDVLEDYVNTMSDLSCWIIDNVMQKGIKIDCAQCWEDICGSTGPLINPEIFTKYIAPGYTKIRNKLEQYGIKFLSVDCDGVIDKLVKSWLDSGVNILYPFEIGKWNADPMVMRKKYGKQLRLMGGFNKYAIGKGKQAIDSEIERRLPLVKDGGYMLVPDHHITPDASLENYKYYLESIRKLRL